MGIYLICFGESEKNLEVALSNNIIGVKQKHSFDKNNYAYLLIKRNNVWTVVARANITDTTSENPFEKPNNYLTYKIENVSICKPYGITELLKESFGYTYGLSLRAPSLITAERFIKDLDKGFVVE